MSVVDSEWLLDWKFRFPFEWVDFKNGEQIVDLKLPNDLVIQFQHFLVSPLEMKYKQIFWPNIIWIFDLRQTAHEVYKMFSSKGTTYKRTPIVNTYKSFKPLKDDLHVTGFHIHKLLGHVDISCISIPEIKWLCPSRTHFMVNFNIIYDLGSDLMLWRLPSQNERYMSGLLFRRKAFKDWLLSEF